MNEEKEREPDGFPKENDLRHDSHDSKSYNCDCCGKEIQTETSTDCFGIKRTTILTGRINCKPFYDNFDMVRLGYYFCELCAEKMSHRLDVLKLKLPIV